MESEMKRPRNCGECVKFLRSNRVSKHGYCNNWAGVDLTEDCVCHPNMGVKKVRVKKEVSK